MCTNTVEFTECFYYPEASLIIGDIDWLRSRCKVSQRQEDKVIEKRKRRLKSDIIIFVHLTTYDGKFENQWNKVE